MPLKVVGFFQSGIADYNKVQSFASIGTAQKLLGKANTHITDIQIKLKDLQQAPAIAKEYAQLFGAADLGSDGALCCPCLSDGRTRRRNGGRLAGSF